MIINIFFILLHSLLFVDYKEKRSPLPSGSSFKSFRSFLNPAFFKSSAPTSLLSIICCIMSSIALIMFFRSKATSWPSSYLSGFSLKPGAPKDDLYL